MSSQRFKKIAAILRDFAHAERHYNKVLRGKQKPCEACGKSHLNGGLCPDCLELAAGACEWKAKS